MPTSGIVGSYGRFIPNLFFNPCSPYLLIQFTYYRLCGMNLRESKIGLPGPHSNFSPAIYLTPESVYISMLCSPFMPFSPSLTVLTSDIGKCREGGGHVIVHVRNDKDPVGVGSLRKFSGFLRVTKSRNYIVRCFLINQNLVHNNVYSSIQVKHLFFFKEV